MKNLTKRTVRIGIGTAAVLVGGLMTAAPAAADGAVTDVITGSTSAECQAQLDAQVELKESLGLDVYNVVNCTAESSVFTGSVTSELSLTGSLDLL